MAGQKLEMKRGPLRVRAGRLGHTLIPGSLATLALTLFVAGHANAQLSEYDDPMLPASADGFNITVDGLTGLEWLDLDVTAGRTFDDIVGLDGSDELGPGGDFEGFRYATSDETTGWNNGPQFDSLFKNFGMGSQFGSIAGYGVVTSFMSYLGCFTNCVTYGFVQGVYVANNDPLDPIWAQAERFPSQGQSFGSLSISQSAPITSRAINGSSAEYGHFLVRDAPEPSASLLLASGAVLLGALEGRRDQRAGRKEGRSRRRSRLAPSAASAATSRITP